MPYIDKDGNVTEKKKGIIELITSFLLMILLFFQSIVGMDRPRTAYRMTADDHRDYLRRNQNPGLGGAAQGRGGGEGGDGFRRNIGRLPGSSGIAPPPMGGGCCGGGGCG